MFAKEDPSDEYIRCAHRVRNKIIKELEREFHLECGGSGGSLAKNVAGLDMHFIAERRASIEEARELFVKCVEKGVLAVNADEAIRPYLAEYPFPASRIDVSISFRNEHGPYQDGTVSLVCQGQQGVAYFIRHPLDKKRPFTYREPYSEALKLVNATPAISATAHKEKPYEKALDQFFEDVAKELDKKWKVDLIEAGGDAGNGIKEIAILCHKYKHATVEEARKLELGITEMLINKLHTHPILSSHLQPPLFTTDQVRVNIAFKESYEHDFYDGTLCSVERKDNKLQYYLYEYVNFDKLFEYQGPIPLDPVLIKEETYQEALQLVSTKK